MPERVLNENWVETGIYTGFAVKPYNFILNNKPQNT